VLAQRDRDTYTNASANALEVVGQVRVVETGLPASRISIRLERFGGGVVDSMDTDSGGRFRFANLQRGYYKVIVNAPGFKPVQQDADLQVVFRAYLVFELAVEKPGAMQQIAEGLLTNPMKIGIRDILDDAAGHHARSFLPFVGTISIFILFANLMSLVPILAAPTGDKTVTLACASMTFVYFNYQGVYFLGLGHYLKNFTAGTPLWIAWLIMPLEMFSSCARVLSLTVRLFANMFAGEMVTLVFFSLVPIGVPIIFEGLHIGVSLIQTYIFVILTCVYLSEATAHEH